MKPYNINSLKAGKVYFGLGISFDFSNGVKIGIAAGVGVEISLNF